MKQGRTAPRASENRCPLARRGRACYNKNGMGKGYNAYPLPADMNSAFTCVVALRRARAFQEARALLARLLARAPQHPRLLTELGNIHYRDGDLGGAEEIFRYILTIAPDFETAAASLCMLYAHTGRHEEAAAYAARIMAAHPRDPLTWYTLGIVFAWRREWRRSLDYSLAAAAMKPDFADAHYNAACAYAQLGCVADALGHLREGLGNFGLLHNAERDPDIDPIRDHPEFDRILRLARRRLEREEPN